MLDRRRIVRQWREGLGKVLVTLVRTEGSSYRRRGAHMLVGPQGENFGTISGGCLEAEVVRKASWAVRNGPVVERYSTLFDDTAEIPYGLGCGGIVDLLLEPVDTPECQALLEALEASLHGVPSKVLTWLPGPDCPLARALFSATGDLQFSSLALPESELASARAALTQPVPPNSPPELVIEHLTPPQRLFILGAGDDVQPVVKFSSLLGWDTVVADGRRQLARPERFPEASAVVPHVNLGALNLYAGDAVVLMSHSYEQDRAALLQLFAPLAAGDAARVPGYIGLLGARHRSSLLVSETSTALGLSLSDCCDRIWAPVGLDLGGDGPEAVALAIIAEVQSWINGRLARSRRLTAEEVSNQILRGGASAYLSSHCAMEPAPR